MFRKNHEILSRPSSFALFIGTHSAGICLAQSGSVPQALLKCTLIVPLPNLMVVLTDVSTRSPWAEKNPCVLDHPKLEIHLPVLLPNLSIMSWTEYFSGGI